ncbi:hypothetical protein WEI85_48155 [Actinomycetes bacterium KLBMP 9797]
MIEDFGDEIERALRVVDWTTHGADPAAVMSAVRQLRLARSKQQGQDAYNAVLDAIGHNHSGWLYDAAGPAAAILVEVARSSQGWPCWAALEILIDCVAWVRPEQRLIDADGRTRSVKTALRDAISGLEPELHTMAADPDTTVPVGKSATDLLEALHEHEV